MGVVAFLLGATQVQAQSFGGIPASTKLQQVNGEFVKVIFPKGMDSAAIRVATIADHVQKNYSGTIGNKRKPISVVLQPAVNYSNGYVALGPWRSEFFLMPPQNPFELGSTNWLDNLATHEIRHAQQYNNFNKGLSKLMGVLFGQNGRALGNAASVPDWFFEGDAVWNETALTGQGRGKLPLFLSSYKSIYRDGRNYSFMKMRNGSLRQYVPNHYDLGYLLVSYGRQAYGDTIWNSITHDAAAFKSLFYPMQAAVKKHTGVRYDQFVQDAIADFREKWKLQTSPTPTWVTEVSDKKVINYQYPYPEENGTIVALKTSGNEIPHFVWLTDMGEEKNLGVKDIGYDDYFSYRNNRIVYTALQPDARWGNRDYSIIKVLDIATKKETSISNKSRFFSPDISNDGKRIVAVEVIPNKSSSLVLLDAEGNELKRLQHDDASIFSHPKFLQGDEEIVAAVRKPNGDMGWLIWQTNDGSSRWLLAPSARLVGLPVVKGDTLFYTATEGQNDGLYAQVLPKGNRYLLANYATGIYQGFTVNGKIVGSFFTAGGYRLGVLPRMFTPMLPAKSNFYTLYGAAGNKAYENVQEVSNGSFTVTNYKKGFKPFNFHSWQPEVSESDYTLRFLGNNVINTTLTDVYYTYNTNETSHAAGGNFRFGGWYVQPIVGAQQTWDRKIYYQNDTTFHYNETELSGGLFLPLNLTGGKSFRYLNLAALVHADQVKWQGIGKGLLRNQDYTFAEGRISYSSQIQKATQHIYPRLAQTILAQYKTMVDDHSAWQMLVTGGFYFPGIGKNHSLVLNAAWQGRDTMQQYLFSNSFPFSRGYTDVNFPRMWKLGANYHFPLLYPDWGFGNIVYFLRVRANGFYDHTEVKSLRSGLSRSFRSTGMEMYFDTKWWNQMPISFGFRYSRLLDNEFSQPTQPNQWEFILPVNLY